MGTPTTLVDHKGKGLTLVLPEGRGYVATLSVEFSVTRKTPPGYI